MDPEKQREIASKGGKSVPKNKRSFAQNKDLATSAGRAGGLNVDPANRSFSRNRELAAQAGMKGGLARGRNYREASTNDPDNVE